MSFKDELDREIRSAYHGMRRAHASSKSEQPPTTSDIHEVRVRYVSEDGAWYEWVHAEENITDWYVREYFPPERTEAWLTLPPGVTVERDDPDWSPRDRFWDSHVPGPHDTELGRRFAKEFSLKAAVDWGLMAEPLDWVMKRVYAPERLREQLHFNRHLLFKDDAGR